MKNPFIVTGYAGPNYFCDREIETQQMLSRIENGMNMAIFSFRRMGKSSLIHHIFNILKSQNWMCIYTDIFSCTDSKEFIRKLTHSVSVHPVFRRSKNRIIHLLSSLKATFSYNELTGQPEISLGMTHEKELFKTIHDILHFLRSYKQNVIVAIDEFQQILEFPEKGFEATFRELCQEFHEIRFIFSGSKKNLMQEMFIDPSRPFFQSTDIMDLREIENEVYKHFIIDNFKQKNKQIDHLLADKLLQQTLKHTYYTHNLTNRVFRISKKEVQVHDIEKAWQEIFIIYDNSLMKLMNDLTPYQLKVLKSLAAEELVTSYQSSKFISAYGLNNPASVKRAVQSLLGKQYLVTTHEGKIRLEDVFLLRRLQAM